MLDKLLTGQYFQHIYFCGRGIDQAESLVFYLRSSLIENRIFVCARGFE